MKRTVLFLTGGRSEEHEISLISTHGVISALDKKKYEPKVIGIAKTGEWYWLDAEKFYVGDLRADRIKLNQKAPQATLLPYTDKKGRGQVDVEGKIENFDVAFPLLHGQYGEDGTIQGMLDLTQAPYVGTKCGGSYLCMDKVMAKSIASVNQIPVADYVWLDSVDQLAHLLPKIKSMGLPLFVKPSAQGSSVGVSKVTKMEELRKAVDFAFKYDKKCLIEKGIKGREIECSVLGKRGKAIASLPAEIIPNAKIGWYSYDAKYLLKDGALTEAPAKLSPSEIKEAQRIALKAFDLLECEDFARVDMFYEEDSSIFYLNEVNTIPGFTPISMYPKMWEVSGVDYQTLISQLIELALGYELRVDSKKILNRA